MVSYIKGGTQLRIFEDRILRRIFGIKEMRIEYSQVMKSRRMRWVGHVARMEEGRSAFKI
jgi:hypothetical protein